MPKHYVRDLPVTDPANYIANGNHMMGNAVLYHFLRVAGWIRLWECDGERYISRGVGFDPNHVVDGNVQSSGTSSWTAYNGATISKDTTKVHSGVRSLKVEASASGKGVSTAALSTMTNPTAFSSDTGDSLSGPVNGEMTYYDDSSRFITNHVGWYLRIGSDARPGNNGDWVIDKYVSEYSVKFRNAAGVAVSYNSTVIPYDVASFTIIPRYEIMVWIATDVAVDVEVDPGTGVFANIGTIPSNGSVFTRYGDIEDSIQLYLKRTGSGSAFVRFVTQGAGTFYIGGLHVYTSVWEKPALTPQGTDGQLTNPDRFSTGGSYTPNGADVGKVLFVFDPAHPKNSGAYPIIADIGGGVVQLDLRSATATLTTQGSLRWRIVSINWQTYPNYSFALAQNFAGFGLQSPHTSGWRYFLRQSQFAGQTTKCSMMWSAPEDTDFDFSNGNFYDTGPSTQRERQADWASVADSSSAASQHVWRGGYSYATSPHDSRIFVMLDEDGAFFNFFMWDEYGEHGCHLHGYLSSDLPGIESFYLIARWEGTGQGSEVYWDQSTVRFGRSGSTFRKDGPSISCCLAQLGIGTAVSPGASPLFQSNAGPNPWSGREWMRPLIFWRDSENMNNPGHAAIQNSDMGIYQTRINRTALTTFESNQFLHLVYGLVWEWSGESLVP